MRMPSDLGGEELARLLRKYDYAVSRQVSSHLRLTTQHNGGHHVTIPNHDPIRLGTLNSIFKDVAEHFGASRAELMETLFGKE